MDIAEVVSMRSNCSRRRVAALIIIQKRIISTGYNGTPKGVRNCMDGGCSRCAESPKSGENLGDCICAHAEENAIVQAAYHGISVRGGMLYCTTAPCLMCAKMIINAGIEEVVYEEEYQFSNPSKTLFMEAKVKIRRFRRG